jgi:hypothetical protein
MPVSRKNRNMKKSSRSRKMSKSKNARRSRKNKKMNQKGGDDEYAKAKFHYLTDAKDGIYVEPIGLTRSTSALYMFKDGYKVYTENKSENKSATPYIERTLAEMQDPNIFFYDRIIYIKKD